jgi:hypothetical protein
MFKKILPHRGKILGSSVKFVEKYFTPPCAPRKGGIIQSCSDGYSPFEGVRGMFFHKVCGKMFCLDSDSTISIYCFIVSL